MQFLLDQYERNKEQGLDYLRAGDVTRARHHLLRGAEYLLRAARQSETKLREIRWERALRLRDLAIGLRVPPPAATPARPAADAGAAERAPVTDAEAADRGWLVSEKPNVKFSQIAGLHDVKEAIALRVIHPLRHPEVAVRFRKRAGGGLLLYGPPGTGKTMIAKAVATELDAQFLSLKSSNILSQWVGVAEQNLARLFQVARRHPVSVIFIDEAEALLPRRGGHSTVMNRVVPEFLAQIDGIDPRTGVMLLMGATNRPWDLDDAALRPGRFGEKFYVPLPDAAARVEILRLNLDGIPMEEAIDLDALGRSLEGYSGADIMGLCIAATDAPFTRQIRSGAEARVTADDLRRAATAVRPSVTPAMLARFRRFEEGAA